MDDIYKKFEEYNPNKKRKILIVFDDIITDILSNKKFNPMVTELFIRGRKLHISLVFIIQSYLLCQKIFDYFLNKWEFQQIVLNYSSDIDFRDFMNL